MHHVHYDCLAPQYWEYYPNIRLCYIGHPCHSSDFRRTPKPKPSSKQNQNLAAIWGLTVDGVCLVKGCHIRTIEDVDTISNERDAYAIVAGRFLRSSESASRRTAFDRDDRDEWKTSPATLSAVYSTRAILPIPISGPALLTCNPNGDSPRLSLSVPTTTPSNSNTTFLFSCPFRCPSSSFTSGSPCPGKRRSRRCWHSSASWHLCHAAGTKSIPACDLWWPTAPAISTSQPSSTQRKYRRPTQSSAWWRRQELPASVTNRDCCCECNRSESESKEDYREPSERDSPRCRWRTLNTDLFRTYTNSSSPCSSSTIGSTP